MFDAVKFVFLHEIGHALMDAYKLPVTGSEEDAADRCAAFINISELGDEGVRNVMAAAEAFSIESKRREQLVIWRTTTFYRSKDFITRFV